MSRETRIRRNDGDVLDGQHRIQALIEALDNPRAKWIVDAPDDPRGEWWIDIALDDFTTAIAWRPDRGFGIYVSDDRAFGARPDEIYREPELAAKRLLQLANRNKGDAAAMRLAEVRTLVGKPQTLVAEHLRRDQGFVSKVERQNDAKLSTIKAYVEALGGEVVLYVRFAGFEANVDLPISWKHQSGETYLCSPCVLQGDHQSRLPPLVTSGRRLRGQRKGPAAT